MNYQNVTLAVWLATPALALTAASFTLWHTRRQLRRIRQSRGAMPNPVRLTPASGTRQSNSAISS